jgi:hypothetical protein
VAPTKMTTLDYCCVAPLLMDHIAVSFLFINFNAFDDLTNLINSLFSLQTFDEALQNLIHSCITLFIL